jgi:hypothetical protein
MCVQQGVRRCLRDIKQASACECKACAAMGDLDFKFVVHHGETVKQKMRWVSTRRRKDS